MLLHRPSGRGGTFSMDGTRQRMRGGNPLILCSIPERRSSRQLNTAASTVPTATRPPRSQSVGTDVPPKGESTSPLRRPHAVRKAPSRTFVPTTWPTDLLVAPILTHARVCLAIRLSSPIFMGGATVEGVVCIQIDGGNPEKKRKLKQALSLRTLSVTLVGIERCKARQEMFRVLQTDLIDQEHPPPATMALDTSLDGCWDVAPSESHLPFCLDLPVAMGPPPYKSKKVGISYWLSALLEFTIASKKHLVRQSREVTILTVHDRKCLIVL